MKANTFSQPSYGARPITPITTGRGLAPMPVPVSPAQHAVMQRPIFGGLAFSSAGSGVQPVGTGVNMWIA